MRRRPRTRATAAPDLFAPRAGAWVVEHWPQYAREAEVGNRSSPLQLWAATFRELPGGARILLITICRLVEYGDGRASIATLAKGTAASSVTTRQRLGRLLTEGLVLVKPWTAKCKGGVSPLGYEFRIIVDDDLRASALATGFKPTRATKPHTKTGARCR
jgi:hypothetical protein